MHIKITEPLLSRFMVGFKQSRYYTNVNKYAVINLGLTYCTNPQG